MVVLGKALGFGRPRVQAARPAVEAHARDEPTVVLDASFISVVDQFHVYVGHGAVIKEVATSPVSAVETHARISEPVVDSAIETDVRSPIAGVPEIESVIEPPVARRPEQTDLGRLDPRAGDPKVAIISPRPITWDPDESRFRANRLLVNRQYRWSDPNGHAETDLRPGVNRHRQHTAKKNHETNNACDTHDSHLPGDCWAGWRAEANALGSGRGEPHSTLKNTRMQRKSQTISLSHLNSTIYFNPSRVCRTDVRSLPGFKIRNIPEF